MGEELLNADPALVRFIRFDQLPLGLFVLLVGLVSAELLARTIDRLGERFSDTRLLLKKIAVVSRFLLYAVVLLAFSSTVFDLHSEALFAVGGTLGIALGFAAKDLLASVMSGLILLVDQPFQVGDRITFGGYYGEVRKIGLRSVRLITLDDNQVTIPNSRFLTEAVASANAGDLDCMVVIPFYLAAQEDFLRARRLIAEATATSRYVFLDKPLVTLVSDEFLGERFVTIVRVKAYVFDARFEKAFMSDVTERVKVALREAGIRTPDLQVRDLDLPEGNVPPPAG